MPPIDVPRDHISVDDLIAELATDTSMAEGMRSARAWVADALYPNEFTVKSLRLRKGLTQAELAQLIGTSQPHVVRIESGNTALMIDTMRKLCVALDIDMNTLDRACHTVDKSLGDARK